MSLYTDAVRDERVRDYLPVKRVLLAERADHTGYWVGNHEIQPLISPKRGADLHPGASVLVDFGIEFHGGVRILNNYPEGKIRLTFGESASEAMQTPDQTHAIHQAELAIPRMGMLAYGNTAFRFVRLENTGTETISILNVIGIAVYRDLAFIGRFESSDERLNQIWKTARYTLQLNMQDYIYDGAKRDRIVWMGDLHPEIRGILAAFGDTSLIERSLDFLVGNTPLPRTMNDITSYSCWYVVSLVDLYRATGNRSFLEKHRPYLEALLRQFLPFIGDDGAERIAERRFLDWPNDDNPAAKHAGLQGLLRWMMTAGTMLLEELGADAGFAREAAAKLLRHVPDCGGSKAAAALLTLNGIADCRDVLAADPMHGVSTFYGFYMLLAQPTLPALALIRQYWGAMLDRGATTFWEDFNLEWLAGSSRIDELPKPGERDLHGDYGAYCYKGLRHSLCHGWSCGPLPFLSERILGVKFLTPGGSRVSIAPDLGDLEYVRGAYPTPHGPIELELERGKSPKIQLPPGIELE